jgi:hypothetical protein
VEKIDAATAALFEYAHRIIEERRGYPPGEDFISLLMQANEGKDALSDACIIASVISLRVPTPRRSRCWPNASAIRGLTASRLGWLPDSGNTGPVRLPIAFDPES